MRHAAPDTLTPPPAQKLQRARGTLRLRLRPGPGGAGPVTLYQSGAAKLFLPRIHGGVTEVVLVNTAGGLTGGDRFETEIALDPGARAVVATQTAERAYRSPGDMAEVDVTLRLGAGAALDWLAQETILFQGARLARRITADLAADARLILAEPVVLGRQAMGEDPTDIAFRDRWRIRRDGRLIHAEAQQLGPPLSALRGPGALGDARAFATLAAFVPDPEPLADRLAALDPPPGLRAGLGLWADKLILRLAARDARALRPGLLTYIDALRAGPPPRVWAL
ncbi:MAG: urease accessory protein UreD [Pseudomonadota bacterium]